jgi:UDP-N-acetylbacillosamine N-acetyltransferase
MNFTKESLDIVEKISIHSFTTIGMNAAVVKDITESGTYVGVPAKKINK